MCQFLGDTPEVPDICKVTLYTTRRHQTTKKKQSYYCIIVLRHVAIMQGHYQGNLCVTK